MGIRNDSPYLAGLLDDYESLQPLKSPKTKEERDAFNREFPPERVLEIFSEHVEELTTAHRKIVAALEGVPIPEAALDLLLASIREDANRTEISSLSVEQWWPSSPDDDWFVRWEYGLNDALDATVSYKVRHPVMFERARKALANLPVEFFPIGTNYAEPKMAALREHNIPDDLSTWDWCHEALQVAQKGLDALGLSMKLSDFVVWTCTGEIPNLHQDETCSPPTLEASVGFGARPVDEQQMARIETCYIWKLSSGELFSPLWEYLSWAGASFGKNEAIARNLGRIGEGIHSALFADDPEYDPDNPHLQRLAYSAAFRAGEAMLRLRVDLELAKHIHMGRKAKEIERKRALRGGEKSKQTRIRRILALLEELERLVGASPDLSRLPPEHFAALAIEDAAKRDPLLWRQGAGQMEEYLGELRRGEAGPDLQARFFSLFPKKPLKGLRLREGRG